MKYVTESRVKIELGLSEEEMLKLRRVQDLVSQSQSKHASLEDALMAMADFYLKGKDPVEKAKRIKVKKGLVNSATPEVRKAVAETLKPEVADESVSRQTREPIPAAILHQVNLRDQRRCCFVNEQGEKCAQSRWTEIHHRLPVSQGGKNTLENLITLCSIHHDWIHRGEGLDAIPRVRPK